MRRSGDIGSTTVETTLVIPALLLVCMLLPVQAFFRGSALIVARAAASQAANTASAADATADDGEEVGRTVAGELGGLTDVRVEVTRRGGTARAVVMGRQLGLVPAPVRWAAERRVSGPP